MFHIFYIIFAIILIVCYTINSIGVIFSIVGSIIISLIISWKITKLVVKYTNNNETISPNQKAILITGCDTGFGNRLAYKLNSIGFMVYATVLDTESDGSKRLQSSAIFPQLIKVIKMDVTNHEQVVKVYDYVREDLERNDHILWGVVNNAGIGTLGYIDWGTMQTYQSAFDVNVFGLVRVTRIFLPLIRLSNGRIINFASVAGKFTYPLASAYSMSKHAVISFSDALRRETQQSGINVSVILPGNFNTGFLSEENINALLDRLWNNTSDTVKQTYSTQSIEVVKKQLYKTTNYMKSDNLDLVVDAIIDALRSAAPQLYYTVVADWSYYIFMSLIDYIPLEWLDILVSKMF